MQSSGLQDKLRKVMTFKNIQSMATGLIWILEAKHAPVLADGKLAIAPFADIGSRYTRSDVNDLVKKKLRHLGSSGKLLRSLPYIINISPAMVFINMDLETSHVDLVAQQEIHRFLSVSKSGLSALPYMEHCMLSIILAICTKGQSAVQVTTAELVAFCDKMPPVVARDTEIFTSLIPFHAANSGQSPAHTVSGHLPPVSSILPIAAAPPVAPTPVVSTRKFVVPKLTSPSQILCVPLLEIQVQSRIKSCTPQRASHSDQSNQVNETAGQLDSADKQPHESNQVGEPKARQLHSADKQPAQSNQVSETEAGQADSADKEPDELNPVGEPEVGEPRLAELWGAKVEDVDASQWYSTLLALNRVDY
ncbi:hypothetical protein B0H14DRAFT_2651467 [Mycena olivaceomarginata]|nr:hypothetical protein B0H14DRAFT_2651467 [Mycena olivaceomarginata]